MLWLTNQRFYPIVLASPNRTATRPLARNSGRDRVVAVR